MDESAVEDKTTSGMGGVRLRVIGNEWGADSPVLGKLTISQADIETTPLSLLEIIKNSPHTYRNTMFFDWIITIEKAPGGGPPLAVANTQTAALLNENLPQFPPRGDMFQLQQPVDLAPVGAPNQIVGQLQQLPLTVSHNP